MVAEMALSVKNDKGPAFWSISITTAMLVDSAAAA